MFSTSARVHPKTRLFTRMFIWRPTCEIAKVTFARWDLNLVIFTREWHECVFDVSKNDLTKAKLFFQCFFGTLGHLMSNYIIELIHFWGPNSKSGAGARKVESFYPSQLFELLLGGTKQPPSGPSSITVYFWISAVVPRPRFSFLKSVHNTLAEFSSWNRVPDPCNTSVTCRASGQQGQKTQVYMHVHFWHSKDRHSAFFTHVLSYCC